MCRIAAYVGDSQEELEELTAGLREAAQKDTTSGRLVTHGDGWGYAIYSDRGIAFYKTKKAIFEDEIALPQTKGKTYAIIHARKASEGYERETRSSHPFFGETQDSYIFFAHNGSLSEGKLRSLPELRNVRKGTIDSELAFRYVLHRELNQATTDLENHVEPHSALNLLILLIFKDGGAEIFVKNFNPKKREYYKIVKQRMAKGKAVFSSTFNYLTDGFLFSGEALGTEKLVPLSKI